MPGLRFVSAAALSRSFLSHLPSRKPYRDSGTASGEAARPYARAYRPQADACVTRFHGDPLRARRSGAVPAVLRRLPGVPQGVRSFQNIRKNALHAGNAGGATSAGAQMPQSLENSGFPAFFTCVTADSRVWRRPRFSKLHENRRYSKLPMDPAFFEDVQKRVTVPLHVSFD